MSRYIAIGFLFSFCSVCLIFLFASAFDDQTGALSVGLVLVIILSIIITFLIRIIELLKSK